MRAEADPLDPESRRQARHAAWRELASVSPGMAAWGLVTGVAMAKSGLPLWAALAMSLSVYAGSAQLAVLPLLAAQAPLWVIVATASCVNLRFVIYSAQWRPYFIHLPRGPRWLAGFLTTDMGYALFMRRYPEVPATAAGREAMMTYFRSSATMNWIVWQTASIIGILAADRIPTHWGLGFAGVLALLALAYAAVRDLRTLAAALLAGACAVASYGLPFKLNIVVAIVAAVALGLGLDGHGGGGRRPASGATPAGPGPGRDGRLQRATA